MVSVPIAVHIDLFKWQLDLFWYSHKCVYGSNASNKAKAVIIKRNQVTETKHQELEWDLDVPHVMCESFFDYFKETTPTNHLHLPLNIQIGLTQIINEFDDDQIIEVLDCDMLHLRPHREMDVRKDQLIVSDIYESWHLKSLSASRHVIEIYFENGGMFYNGGFVPIIGRVRTFKKILPEWIAVHRHILSLNHPELIKWWAGMYALQAACEKAKVQMVAEDCCYVPGINELSDSHHVCHYACDAKFDKKRYPHIDPAVFGTNRYYERILSWPGFLK